MPSNRLSSHRFHPYEKPSYRIEQEPKDHQSLEDLEGMLRFVQALKELPPIQQTRRGADVRVADLSLTPPKLSPGSRLIHDRSEDAEFVAPKITEDSVLMHPLNEPLPQPEAGVRIEDLDIDIAIAMLIMYALYSLFIYTLHIMRTLQWS